MLQLFVIAEEGFSLALVRAGLAFEAVTGVGPCKVRLLGTIDFGVSLLLFPRLFLPQTVSKRLLACYFHEAFLVRCIHFVLDVEEVIADRLVIEINSGDAGRSSGTVMSRLLPRIHQLLNENRRTA